MKKENFRPKFDVEKVTSLTRNKSEFYNEAIIEKLDSIELEYPKELHELQKIYKYKKELYDERNEEITEKQKRIQVLENKNKELLEEMKKLESDIDKYSKVVKRIENIKENRESLIKENESIIIERCKMILRMVISDGGIYNINDGVKKATEKELKDVFKDWTDFKSNYLYKFFTDNVKIGYTSEIRKYDKWYEHDIDDKDLNVLHDIVDNDLL